MIDRVVGTYKMLEKIGEGGMGAVYRGVDLMLEREVAVKVLHPDLAHQPNLVERFRSEAVTLAKINHPNVAMLYSFLREADGLFMVMEFVRGEPLDDVIRRTGPMTLAQTAHLFGQALDGIAFAHQLGIIHRDIKPANMMVTAQGGVKVMDFGIARVLGTSRMTRTGHLIGTLEYMPPEQIRGRDVDARSDIYSLGILLYEMLTGQVPFASDSDYELMRAQIEKLPPPPRVIAAHIPEPVEHVILRALEKEPEARFATVTAFHKALDEGVRAGYPPTPETRTPHGPPPTRIAEATPPPTRIAEAAPPSDTHPQETHPAAAALSVAKPTRAADAQDASGNLKSTRVAAEAEVAAVGVPKATRAAGAYVQGDDGTGAAPSPFDALVATWRLDRLGPKHYVGISLIVLLLVLLPMAFWLSGPAERSNDPVVENPTPNTDSPPASESTLLEQSALEPAESGNDQPLQPGPTPGPVPARTDDVTTPSDIARNVTVSNWLAQARTHFAANQLTTPAGNNTLDLCGRVLEVDPGNQDAVDLLRQIVQRYTSWGDTQMQQGDPTTAVTHYRKGLDVAQRYPDVLAQHAAGAREKLGKAQARLAEARPVEPAPDTRPGQLRVVVRPFGDIFVEGGRKARDTNRPYSEELPAGTYRVRAVHPSFGQWEKQISVKAGETREVLFNFNAEYQVTVTSQPPNAEILLEGKSTGRYTPSVLTVRPGQHTITVRRDGYASVEGPRNLVVERTLTDPVHFTLQRK